MEVRSDKPGGAVKIIMKICLSATDMGLVIIKLLSGLYEATATPPHVREDWSTSEPIAARDLIRELQSLGCHQQDIGDALYEQDPAWVEKFYD